MLESTDVWWHISVKIYTLRGTKTLDWNTETSLRLNPHKETSLINSPTYSRAGRTNCSWSRQPQRRVSRVKLCGERWRDVGGGDMKEQQWDERVLWLSHGHLWIDLRTKDEFYFKLAPHCQAMKPSCEISASVLFPGGSLHDEAHKQTSY